MKKSVKNLLKIANIEINGTRDWDIQIKNEKFYTRVLSEGSLGLGESYMEGWWDSKKLDEFFYKLLYSNVKEKVKNKHTILEIIKAKLLNPQSIKRSKQVAEQHYNLGNKFYEDMLDPYMQYTCAYFKNTDKLNEAQIKKLDLICKKLQLKKGMTVLELGCGWGGFARFATKNYGVKVTGYNISTEQVNYAKKKCEGLEVKFILEDYRNAKGKFDRVLSVGMMEHVGKKNYNTFMKLISSCLKKEGIALIHTIGRSKPRRLVSDPWINKYIFPGGSLPTISQILKNGEKYLTVEDVQNMGTSYDKTLMAWFENFNKNWKKNSERGDEFYRMWKYYLLSCAGSFRAREIQLWQIIFTKRKKEGIISPR